VPIAPVARRTGKKYRPGGPRGGWPVWETVGRNGSESTHDPPARYRECRGERASQRRGSLGLHCRSVRILRPRMLAAYDVRSRLLHTWRPNRHLGSDSFFDGRRDLPWNTGFGRRETHKTDHELTFARRARTCHLDCPAVRYPPASPHRCGRDLNPRAVYHRGLRHNRVIWDLAWQYHHSLASCYLV